MNKVTYPLWTFPSELQEILRKEAKSIGCPIDYLACGLWLAISVICGNSHVLKIKDGFIIRAMLYMAIVGAPGWKKTPALRFTLRVLIHIQKRAKELYDDKLTQYEKDLEAYAEGIIEEKPIKPVKPLYVVTDATVEALVRQLKKNPRGLVLFKDELGGLFHGMNQYKNGADVDFYLELWDKELVSCVRVSLKEEIEIFWPFTSIGGGIQPDVLSTINEMKDNGFRDRILWSYPEKPTKKFSFSDDNDGNSEAYCDILMNIFLKIEDCQEVELTISEEAKPFFEKAMNELEAEADDEETPEFLSGSILKLTSYYGRFTLLSAILHSQGNPDKEIGIEIVKKAYEVVKYFKSHCEDVYVESNSENLKKHQEKLLSWIKKQYREKKIQGGIPVSKVLAAKIPGIDKKGAEFVKILFEELRDAGYGGIRIRENKNRQEVPYFWLNKTYRE